MALRLLLLFSIIIIAGCQAVSDVTPVTQKCELPKDSSYWYYACTQDGGKTEIDTADLLCHPDTSYSESFRCSAYTSNDLQTLRLHLLETGDLKIVYQNCWEVPLGFYTHKHYDGYHAVVPGSFNGYKYTTQMDVYTDYLGDETVTCGGHRYNCSKVSYTIRYIDTNDVGEKKPKTSALVETFWYSPELKSFARISGEGTGEHSDDFTVRNYDRILVSHD